MQPGDEARGATTEFELCGCGAGCGEGVVEILRLAFEFEADYREQALQHLKDSASDPAESSADAQSLENP